MIEDVYYEVHFHSASPYGAEAAYYALDADDAGRLDDFVGNAAQIVSLEEIGEDEWDRAIESGAYTWYTAYPPQGHAFWFLAHGEPVDHDPEIMDVLLSPDIENYEEYRFLNMSR